MKMTGCSHQRIFVIILKMKEFISTTEYGFNLWKTNYGLVFKSIGGYDNFLHIIIFNAICIECLEIKKRTF